MKRILLSAVTLLSVSLSAQVGINTTDPKATLDVNGDMKVSTKVGASDQTDVLTVLENGKVGVNIKDFKNNSDNEAVLQVGGLIQSSTIRTKNAPSADKLVVVDNMGVMKTIAKASLDYGNAINRLSNELRTLKRKSNSIDENAQIINTVQSRLSAIEAKLSASTRGTMVGTCGPRAVLLQIDKRGDDLEAHDIGNARWVRDDGPYLCICWDVSLTRNVYDRVTGIVSCSYK